MKLRQESKKKRKKKKKKTGKSHATSSTVEDALSGDASLVEYKRQGVDDLRDYILPLAIQQAGDPTYWKRVFDHVEKLIQKEWENDDELKRKWKEKSKEAARAEREEKNIGATAEGSATFMKTLHHQRSSVETFDSNESEDSMQENMSDEEESFQQKSPPQSRKKNAICRNTTTTPTNSTTTTSTTGTSTTTSTTITTATTTGRSCRDPRRSSKLIHVCENTTKGTKNGKRRRRCDVRGDKGTKKGQKVRKLSKF